MSQKSFAIKKGVTDGVGKDVDLKTRMAALHWEPKYYPDHGVRRY